MQGEGVRRQVLDLFDASIEKGEYRTVQSLADEVGVTKPRVSAILKSAGRDWEEIRIFRSVDEWTCIECGGQRSKGSKRCRRCFKTTMGIERREWLASRPRCPVCNGFVAEESQCKRCVWLEERRNDGSEV